MSGACPAGARGGRSRAGLDGFAGAGRGRRVGLPGVVAGEADNFDRVEIERAGGETEGYTRIVSGLRLGEKVVTKGSFTLKAQLMKSQFGEDEN